MKSHIEINALNLEHNLSTFFQLSNKKIMFTVKANAYGHGLEQIIKITKDLDYIQYFAVDTIEEALKIRKIEKQKSILIIGWCDEHEIREALANHFEIIAPSLDFIKTVKKIAREIQTTARIHLKVETGTYRLGMQPEDIKTLLNQPPDKHLHFSGIYSHFANIEDTTNHSYAKQQLEVFNRISEKINQHNLIKHFSCSASTLLFPETYFDVVRIGISAYGYWPSKQTFVSYMEKNKKNITLKPVLSWHTKVAQVKSLQKGEYIGYGLTYKTFSKTRVIVVPVGYYDGYDRKLSNISNIIVKRTKAPVRGRICMNMLMAEISHIKSIKPGDPVTLIGCQGKESLDADYLADLASSINYEILARINPLIPRIIIPSGSKQS